MRNLKRALSLLLSSTMVLGMVVMGGSAVGYQDVDASNNNQEAIEVLQAVGIMTGVDDQGNFNPDGGITRNEMAVVMAHLLNLDYDYYRGTNPFTDVPDWAAPYVAACAAEGVVAGIGDGKFGGDNAVTAAQASLMIMKALGYFQNQEDFGDDWQIATIRQASYINMFDKVDSTAEAALTRGQVAQLVLNGLKANMVTFTGDKGVQIGDVTVGYHAEYTDRTNAAAKYNTIVTGTTTINADNGQYYIQLGEELYNGDLKLSPATDEFGRPTNQWEYLNDEVGNYVRNELLLKEYTSEVTGRDLYDLLNRYIVANDTLKVYIDGVDDADYATMFGSNNLIKSNTKAIGGTGNGVLTQVYRDASAGVITVSIINTYLAEATDDFDVDNDNLDVTVYGYKTAGGANIKAIWDANKDGITSKMVADNEIVPVSNYVDGDLMLVRISDGEIVEVMDPQIDSDVTLTAFSLTENTITYDGNTVDQADSRLYDEEILTAYSANPENLKDLTYNVILDPYGYYIGLERNEDPDQYVFITGYEPYTKNLTTAVADAGAIFVDGTMDTIEVKVDQDLANDTWTPDGNPVLNRWYTYSVGSNGQYTLNPVEIANNAEPTTEIAQFAWSYTDANKDIDKSHNSLPGWADTIDQTQGSASAVGGVVYGNEETAYITVGTESLNNTSIAPTVATIIDEVNSVTVGVQNANISVTKVDDLDRDTTSGGVYTLYGDDGYIIASIVVGEDAAATTNYVFVSSTDANLETYGTKTRAADDEATHTWTREVIINGKTDKLTYTGDSINYIGSSAGSSRMYQGNVYKVSYNAAGEVTKSELAVEIFNPNNESTAYADIKNLGAQVVGDIAAIEGNDDAVLLAMNLLTTNQTITLSGRTMYLSQDPTHGLSIMPGANAVLVERVDGVAYDEVTYFDDSDSGADNVQDALEAMYEGHSTNFDGMIYAIMNDGVATTVIFVDNKNRPGVNDGGSVQGSGNLPTLYSAVSLPDGTQLSGSSANATFNINNFGMMVVKADYKAPEWVAGGTKVTLTNVPVLYYGVPTGVEITLTGVIGSDGKATLTGYSNAWDFMVYTNQDELTFGTPDTETFAGTIKAYWFSQDNKDLSATLTNETTSVSTSQAASITATLANTSTGNAQFKSEGLTSNWTSWTAVSFADLKNGWTTGSTKKAAGTGPVVFTLDISGMIDTYSVTNNVTSITLSDKGIEGADASATVALTITTTPLTNLLPNAELKGEIQFSKSSVGETKYYGYKVNCAKLGIKDVILTDNTAANWSIRVNSNMTIDDSDFTITPVDKLKVLSYTYDAGKVVITFNKDMKNDASIDAGTSTEAIVYNNAGSGTAADLKVSVSGNVVTVTATTGDFLVGDKLTIADADATAVDGDKLAADVVITLGTALS